MAGLLFVFPLPKQRVAATAGKNHNILVLPVTLRKLLTAKPGCGGDAPMLKLVARFGVKRRSSTGKTGRNSCGYFVAFFC